MGPVQGFIRPPVSKDEDDIVEVVDDKAKSGSSGMAGLLEEIRKRRKQ